MANKRGSKRQKKKKVKDRQETLDFFGSVDSDHNDKRSKNSRPSETKKPHPLSHSGGQHANPSTRLKTRHLPPTPPSSKSAAKNGSLEQDRLGNDFDQDLLVADRVEWTCATDQHPSMIAMLDQILEVGECAILKQWKTSDLSDEHQGENSTISCRNRKLFSIEIEEPADWHITRILKTLVAGTQSQREVEGLENLCRLLEKSSPVRTQMLTVINPLPLQFKRLVTFKRSDVISATDLSTASQEPSWSCKLSPVLRQRLKALKDEEHTEPMTKGSNAKGKGPVKGVFPSKAASSSSATNNGEHKPPAFAKQPSRHDSLHSGPFYHAIMLAIFDQELLKCYKTLDCSFRSKAIPPHYDKQQMINAMLDRTLHKVTSLRDAISELKPHTEHLLLDKNFGLYVERVVRMPNEQDKEKGNEYFDSLPAFKLEVLEDPNLAVLRPNSRRDLVSMEGLPIGEWKGVSFNGIKPEGTWFTAILDARFAEATLKLEVLKSNDFDVALDIPYLDDECRKARRLIFSWLHTGPHTYGLGRAKWREVPTLRRYQYLRDAYLASMICRGRSYAREQLQMRFARTDGTPFTDQELHLKHMEFMAGEQGYWSTLEKELGGWEGHLQLAKREYPAVEDMFEEIAVLAGEGEVVDPHAVEMVRKVWGIEGILEVEMRVGTRSKDLDWC